MADLEKRVLEIAEIAKKCPENLQQICFEVLLKHHLESSLRGTPTKEKAPTKRSKDQQPPEINAVVQDEISETDLHVKVRKFMEKYNVSSNSLNNLFYKEDGAILPLYEDLKTTKLSES